MPRANGSRPSGQPRPVVGHVDHDPAVALPHLDRDGRAVPQPVLDEVRERLTESRRIRGDTRAALDGHHDALRREPAGERAHVDGLRPEREQLRIRDEPLDVAAGGDGERDQPPTFRGRRRRSGCGERLERGHGAPQLVGDDAEPVAVGHARLLDPRDGPPGRRRERGVGVVDERQRRPLVAGTARVAERDERVAAQPAWVVARHEEPVELLDELVAVALEPVDERDRGLRVARERLPGTTLLDTPVPGADVLADVAPVDAILERVHHVAGELAGRLRPVREAPGRVEHAGLVERARRARLDAQRAAAAARVEGGRRLQLDVGHERAEHDPGSVRARDQHRVLADEPDARALRAGAVDVVVLVDEDAVRAAELPTERVEALPQERVVVAPGVPRQPALSRAPAPARARSSRARPRSPCARPRAGSRGGRRPRASPS